MSKTSERYTRAAAYKIILILFLGLSSCSEELNEIIEPQVLDAPSHFEVYSLNDTGIHLSWIDNSNSEDGYILEKKIDQYHLSFDTLVILPANTISFSDTAIDLDSTKIIEYCVYAYKKNIRSQQIKILYNTGTFNKPSNLAMNALSETSIRLTWDYHSSFESGFIIERKTANSEFQKLADVNANITDFVDYELEQISTYQYRVAARFKQSLSGYSNEILVKYGFDVESSISVPNTNYYSKIVKLIPGSDRIMVTSGYPGWPEPTDNVNVYNLSGEPVYEIPLQSTSAVSPDGKIIATTRSGSDINIWDASNGSFIRSIKRLNPELPPRAMAVSQKENLLAIFELSKDVAEGFLRVHNLTDGSLKWERKYASLWHIVLDFTSEGNLIYTTASRFLRMSKASNDSLIYSFNVREAFNANFSRSGNYVVVSTAADDYYGTTSDIYVWDLEGKYLKQKIMGINPSDAILVENDVGEPELRYAYNSNGWKIIQGNLSSPVLGLGVQNLMFIPDSDLMLGYGNNSSVKVFKLKKNWYSEASGQ